jgi:hypothetical protein
MIEGIFELQDALLKCLIAVLVVVVSMYVAIRLVRFAATLCVTILALGGVGFAIYQVATGQWNDWLAIVFGSLVTGAAAALLSLPALPFTHYTKRQ